jgi:hypothetical protein
LLDFDRKWKENVEPSAVHLDNSLRDGEVAKPGPPFLRVIEVSALKFLE